MTFSDTASRMLGVDEKEEKFYGKYRGVVLQNVDPMFRGRIQVQVPGIVMPPSTWAEPCVPVAGIQAGIYAVPPLGSGVWVEFEQGDPDRPIWVGGFWGSLAEVPTIAQVPPIPPGQNIVIQTTLQNMVVVSDAPPTPLTGGIILRSTTGAMIVVNDSGIFISNGKGAMITMTGPMITMNNGALVVM
jgi:hypothetical protein